MGEGTGRVGEEERVIIDVERQRQAGEGKGAGKKIQMGEKGLPHIKPSQGHDAAMIVDNLKQVAGGGIATKPTVRRGVVLPKLADLLDLPAPHGFAVSFELGIGSQAVSQCPSAHTGSINAQAVASVNFVGSKCVGRRRAGS